jgi:hypothetical protein
MFTAKVQHTRLYVLLKTPQFKNPDFALPGRKALLKSDMEYEIALIDTSQ